jgi:uncharacterized membrane protein
MRLSKFLQAISLFTILAFIYTHMQMQIFDLAYQGKKKEKEAIELMEYNAMVTYDILRLKSADHLGVKLLSQNSLLHFRDNNNVVQLVTSEPVGGARSAVSTPAVKKTNFLLSLLSLRSQAEARAAERVETTKPWQQRAR